ncbi:terminase small subunit [Rouxiella sp. Mn2063]|uniref:terminase small subunit n=1 Tax=Rouxiella sp. Mn2063 TaxID=3395262 RepID=UPI003BDA43EF
MPVLAKPNEEKFAQSFVELGNASEAYRAAYKADKMSDNAISVEAHRVKERPRVSLRIKELQGEVKQRHNVTVDSLIAELEEARQKALSAETPQSSAAVAATMGKAKLTGLDKQIVELQGSVGLNLNKSLNELFEDDGD